MTADDPNPRVGATDSSTAHAGGGSASGSSARPAQDHATVFAAHRALLFTVAYEITGSTADAEDAVQDAYLRWSAADRSEVVDAKAYLARIVTRLALNQLRTRQRRREDYVGPWLPEPLLTAPDIAEDAILTESVSMAMLVVLESLSPDERVVFVLHDVFGFPHPDIATTLDKSAAAVRQIASRARSAVQARRPRFRVDPVAGPAALAGFAQATATGDLQALLTTLAPDVIVYSDGGGKVAAARRPVSGADDVARLLLGLLRKAASNSRMTVEPAAVNGMPGAVVLLDGVLDLVVLIGLDGGLVRTIYLVRNPDKLRHAEQTTPLSRWAVEPVG